MSQDKPKVYFSKEITPSKLVELYKKLNIALPGKVALKVHSGEPGNKYFLKPEFLKDIYDYTNGTFVECNVAYQGPRNKTEDHKKVMEQHGWSKYRYEILDGEGEETLEIPEGLNLKQNIVGKGIKNYDSCLVLAHFKATINGFGGSIKQLSIGCASSNGKSLIHTGGKHFDEPFFKHLAPSEIFTQSLADAAYSVVKHFKGNIACINVLNNISIHCDCDKNAPEPPIKDIGILCSTDPVAIDQACVDLIYKSEDPHKRELTDIFEKHFASNTLISGAKLGMGKRDYELICID